jgi:hypothetical protein
MMEEREMAYLRVYIKLDEVDASCRKPIKKHGVVFPSLHEFIGI